MKTFFAFVRKEFYHIFRDKRTILILIVMPVIQICLFGFALSVEIRNIDVAVIDPTPTEASRRIIERVNANEYFTVIGNLHSPSEIDPMMRSNKVDVVLLFSPDFENGLIPGGDAAIQFAVDASDPNTAATESMYLTQILRGAIAGGLSDTNGQMITSSVRMLFNPQMKSAYNFVPGVMGLLLILICALMTSVSIVREKETGTMEALLVSPVKPEYIIFAKMVPYFTVSCFNFATILLLSYFV
ncbi:MAG: ABC transporter permease, partial [Bacteroidales bacterium]